MRGETGLISGGAVQSAGPSEEWTLGRGGAGEGGCSWGGIGGGGGGAGWFPGVLETGGRAALESGAHREDMQSRWINYIH